MDKQNEHNIDKLLKQVLKDDLPADAEFRMQRTMAVFRHAMTQSEDPRLARSAWWPKRPLVFAQLRNGISRREVLAFVSAIMLAAGAVIHLGGYQNLLADSISLLKISMSVTEQIRLAESMDCVVKMPRAGTQDAIYHIRWVRDGGTRVDVGSPRGPDETWWIDQGRAIAKSPADMSDRPADALTALQEPVSTLLSPADLARRLDERWQLQHEETQRNPDTLIFIDRHDRAVIEVHFARKSFLPTTLSRTRPKAATAEFIWNEPIAPELMVHRPTSGR